jgi:hypothetical protein
MCQHADYGSGNGLPVDQLNEPLRGWDDVWSTRREVFNTCMESLQAAELVFAWITGPDIAGTLVELGAAYSVRESSARRLPKIVVTSPEYFKDLWFAYQTADGVIFRTSSVTAAWDSTCDAIPELFPEHQQMPDLGTSTILGTARNTRHTPEYLAFLNGPVWDKIRRSMLDRANYQCQRCRAQDVILQVHHKHYRKPFGQETPEDLEVLCVTCHKHADTARKRKH